MDTPYTVDHREQVIAEVLGDTDFYYVSEGGPNGPWEYKSIALGRVHNTIITICPTTGTLLTQIPVADLMVEDRSISEELKRRIEHVNADYCATE